MTNTLTKIAKDATAAERLSARRDAQFVQARREGATWREIAEAAKLTELAVRNAATRANGGDLPAPGV